MYIAHVKVAFYIYMFETYDIDLLPKLDNPFMYSQDVQMQENSSQIRDKHFFINFQAYNIPTELKFCDSMDTHVKEYCNENDQVSAWQQAPVMDAHSVTHSTRSNMHDWTANVHRQLFPLFPNEFESITPTCRCVRLTRMYVCACTRDTCVRVCTTRVCVCAPLSVRRGASRRSRGAGGGARQRHGQVDGGAARRLAQGASGRHADVL